LETFLQCGDNAARCTTSQKRRIWIRWKRLPRYRPHDAIHHQACALLKIFDSLFRRGVEGAGDIAGREYLGHYKDPLKSSYVATCGADADCWTAVHKFHSICFCPLLMP